MVRCSGNESVSIYDLSGHNHRDKLVGEGHRYLVLLIEMGLGSWPLFPRPRNSSRQAEGVDLLVWFPGWH